MKPHPVLSHSLVAAIISRYGWRARQVATPQTGYRNQAYKVTLDDGRAVNVILYKREPEITGRIRAAHAVAASAVQAGLPVRRTLDSRILRLGRGAATRYAAVYTYLPGETIAWEAYTRTHIKLLGQALSDLHASLRQCDGELPDVCDEYSAIIRRMRRYFRDTSVRQALAQKLRLNLDDRALAAMIPVLQQCRLLPNQQALHMDFVRSNILFAPAAATDRWQRNGLALTGVLDFEKAARGSVLFDVARTLAFLLIDCKYTAPKKVRKYFLQSGYAKRGIADIPPHTVRRRGREINLLNALLTLFWLYDFYKFLRHNPYESLPDNEHFVRLQSTLLENHYLTMVQ